MFILIHSRHIIRLMHLSFTVRTNYPDKLARIEYHFPNYVYPNPPFQLPLWEKTVVPGENTRVLAER